MQINHKGLGTQKIQHIGLSLLVQHLTMHSYYRGKGKVMKIFSLITILGLICFTTIALADNYEVDQGTTTYKNKVGLNPDEGKQPPPQIQKIDPPSTPKTPPKEAKPNTGTSTGDNYSLDPSGSTIRGPSKNEN